MRAYDMRLKRLLQLPGLLLVCFLVLTACTSAVRDTRYTSAVQGPPLKIPAGMDTPTYNPQMQVPAAEGEYRGKIDTSFAPIRPPQLDDTE